MKAKKIILQFICPDNAGVLICCNSILYLKEMLL
jgi:hypothetical protein